MLQFKNVGSNIYVPFLGSSETEGNVDPSCSKVSSVSNTAVTLTRRQLPDVCQIISGETIFSSYANFKKLDYAFLEEDKWETGACAEGDVEQFSASYKEAQIFIETDYRSKPEFIVVKVFPSISTDMKFDSLEHLFRFVEQREDAACARRTEAQGKHSIPGAVNSVRTGRE